MDYTGHKFFIPSKWLSDGYWHGKLTELAGLVYIIGTANYKTDKFTRGNTVIDLHRGECVISHRSFADKMGRNKSWTGSFIAKYKKLGYFRTEIRQGILVVTVCNYDEISGLPDTRPDTLPDERPDRSRTSTRTNPSNTSNISNTSAYLPPKKFVNLNEDGKYRIDGVVIKITHKDYEESWYRQFGKYWERPDFVQQLRELDKWCFEKGIDKGWPIRVRKALENKTKTMATRSSLVYL